MVRPLQRGTDGPVDELFAAIGATVVAVDRAVALRAAQLRARHRSLRPPDGLSLATALAFAAELLTFDQRLQGIADRET